MKINAINIAQAKELAENNFIESAETGDEGMTYFMFDGIKIINPWVDETGCLDLTDKEAIKLYGLQNVLNFIANILKEGK